MFRGPSSWKTFVETVSGALTGHGYMLGIQSSWFKCERIRLTLVRQCYIRQGQMLQRTAFQALIKECSTHRYAQRQYPTRWRLVLCFQRTGVILIRFTVICDYSIDSFLKDSASITSLLLTHAPHAQTGGLNFTVGGNRLRKKHCGIGVLSAQSVALAEKVIQT